MTLTRKLALLIAGSLTAFILVTAGALIAYNSAQTPTASAQTQTQAQPGAPAANRAAAPTQTQAAPRDAVTAAPAYAVPAEQAESLALNAVPGATVQSAPRLVSFQGTAAYEVVLDRGPVYIDANSGSVLYNGAAQTTAAGFAQDDHEQYERDGEREHNEVYEYEEYEHDDD